MGNCYNNKTNYRSKKSSSLSKMPTHSINKFYEKKYNMSREEFNIKKT